MLAVLIWELHIPGDGISSQRHGGGTQRGGLNVFRARTELEGAMQLPSPSLHYSLHDRAVNQKTSC